MPVLTPDAYDSRRNVVYATVTVPEREDPTDVYRVGQEVINGPLRLDAYNPERPRWYDTKAQRVREALGDRIVRARTLAPGL
ncbi:MAG TPA: hypothetical protein VK059_02655 [Nocardioidaceae bacterium]|nr:hypothetical protein [Nocardioidaceae bacterium]